MAYCLIVDACRLLSACGLSFVVPCVLLIGLCVVCCVLFACVVVCCMLFVWRLFFVGCCLLLVMYCVLVFVCYLLFVIRCWAAADDWSLLGAGC